MILARRRWNIMLLVAFLISISSLGARRIQLRWPGSMQKLPAYQLKFRIGRLGSTSADLDTRVRSTFFHLAFVFEPWLPDFVDVAQVISKYAAAQIPLETMWTDIGKHPFPPSLSIPISQVPQIIWIADESLL
jgi:hypothetical protein